MLVFGSIRWLLKITKVKLTEAHQETIKSINQQLQTEAVVLLASHHDKADIPRMLIALAEYVKCAEHVIVPVSYLGYKHPFLKREIVDRFYHNIGNHLDAKRMADALAPENNPSGIEVYSAWRRFEQDRYEAGELTEQDKAQGQALFKLYIKRTQPIFRNPQKFPRTVIVLAPSARMTLKGEQSVDALYSKLMNGIAVYCMALEWTPKLSFALSQLFLAQVRLYRYPWRLNDPETYHITQGDDLSLERANTEVDAIYHQIEEYGENQPRIRRLLVQIGSISLNLEQIVRDVRQWLRNMRKAFDTSFGRAD